MLQRQPLCMIPLCAWTGARGAGRPPLSLLMPRPADFVLCDYVPFSLGAVASGLCSFPTPLSRCAPVVFLMTCVSCSWHANYAPCARCPYATWQCTPMRWQRACAGDTMAMWFVAAWHAWRNLAVGRLRMQCFYGAHCARGATQVMQRAFYCHAFIRRK
jgi:hypothetical protein